MTTHPTPPATDAFTQDCAFCREHLDEAALGILDDAYAARVDSHLAFCAACRREREALDRVIGYLPFACDPATPSPDLRSRLMSSLASESDRPANASWRRSASSRARSRLNAPSAVSRTVSAVPNWLWPTIVAPLAIALIVLGAWSNAMRHDLDSLQNEPASATVASVEDGVQLYSMNPSCTDCEHRDASGQLGGNLDDTTGVVIAWNLDPNENHQVWCVDENGEKILVSELQVAQSGDVFQTVNFPAEIGGYQQVYVARQDGTEELVVALKEETAEEIVTPSAPAPEDEPTIEID